MRSLYYYIRSSFFIQMEFRWMCSIFVVCFFLLLFLSIQSQASAKEIINSSKNFHMYSILTLQINCMHNIIIQQSSIVVTSTLFTTHIGDIFQTEQESSTLCGKTKTILSFMLLLQILKIFFLSFWLFETMSKLLVKH